MRQRDRLSRAVLGGTIEPGLGPVLLTIGLGVSGMYMFWSMFALWAIAEFGMTKGTVGLVYLAGALVGMSGGLLGGAISDRVGRRRVILGASLAQLALTSVLVVPGLPVAAAVGVLVAFALTQPIRGAASGALIADLVPDARRTAAFGTFRIVFNAGALLGPLLAAGLVSISWSAVHVGIATMYALSSLAATRLPDTREGVSGSRTPSVLAPFRSGVFRVLLVAGILAATTYNAFETLLPISLTQEHGYAPAAWGVLFAVNPLLVMLFQLRVTRWTSPLPQGVRLALGLLGMGGSFLLTLGGTGVGVLVAVVVVFVAGEMLWSPNADALTARAAPPESRGAFLGALGISSWLGGAIAPAIGLRVADIAGDEVMWIVIAAISAAGALAFLVADRLVASEARTRPAAMALEPAG